LEKKERKYDTLGEMQTILCDWHYGRLEMEECRTIKNEFRQLIMDHLIQNFR